MAYSKLWQVAQKDGEVSELKIAVDKGSSDVAREASRMQVIPGCAVPA